jgi:hypothetical protein
MSYAAVTSFSPKGYEVYGKRFIGSFLKFWPADVILHVGYERQKPDIEHERIRYFDIAKDEQREAFLVRHSRFPERNGIVQQGGKPVKDYRWDAVKFANKVFAYTSLKIETDWLIWLDADVETYAPVTGGWLERACPEGFTASYLGRMGWHHSELGWCAFSKRYRGDEFLARMREMYTTDELFKLAETHDSFVWDHVRSELEEQGYMFFNLSQHVPGMHVWPKTLLGQVMTHHKGPVAKLEAYGEAA